MARKKASFDKEPRNRPAQSPDARENQLISLAVNLAEKQLMEGTATSQVIVHYLKLATSREKLEREKLETENELLRAKIKSIESGSRIEELYRDAMDAMRRYNGSENDDY